MLNTMMSGTSPYVIAFFHQKGGVGKTTATFNVGAVLAEMHQPTLMIDLDPSGNLTSGIGLKMSEVEYSLANILLGNDLLAQTIRPTKMPYLFIVPSNNEMQTASKFVTLRRKYELLLRNSIIAYRKPVRGVTSQHFKWILIDCPPSGMPLVMNALNAANLLIIPLRCEYYSLQSLALVFDLLKKARGKSNPKLDFRLLANMYDTNDAIQRMLLNRLYTNYQDAMFDTVISNDNKLSISQFTGKPISSYQVNSNAIKQYPALAQEIISIAQGSGAI